MARFATCLFGVVWFVVFRLVTVHTTIWCRSFCLVETARIPPSTSSFNVKVTTTELNNTFDLRCYLVLICNVMDKWCMCYVLWTKRHINCKSFYIFFICAKIYVMCKVQLITVLERKPRGIDTYRKYRFAVCLACVYMEMIHTHLLHAAAREAFSPRKSSRRARGPSRRSSGGPST